MTVRTRWSVEQPAPQSSNQLVVQRTPADEIVLTFGYVVAPIILGSAEERQEQVDQIAERGLEVRSVARLVLTLKTARALHQLLGQIAAEGS